MGMCEGRFYHVTCLDCDKNVIKELRHFFRSFVFQWFFPGKMVASTYYYIACQVYYPYIYDSHSCATNAESKLKKPVTLSNFSATLAIFSKHSGFVAACPNY